MRIQRDSSFLVARVTSDTIRVVDSSPDVQKAITKISDIIVMFEHVARWLLILAALLLPLPVLLVSGTRAWAVLRGRATG